MRLTRRPGFSRPAAVHRFPSIFPRRRWSRRIGVYGEQLKTIAALRDSGALTADEFEV